MLLVEEDIDEETRYSSQVLDKLLRKIIYILNLIFRCINKKGEKWYPMSQTYICIPLWHTSTVEMIQSSKNYYLDHQI